VILYLTRLQLENAVFKLQLLLLGEVYVSADVTHLDVVFDVFLREEEALKMVPGLRLAVPIVEA